MTTNEAAFTMEPTMTPPSGAKPMTGKTRIEVYSDGSAKGNPGPGGWGFVALLQNEGGEIIAKEERRCSNLYITTNNREEMSAALNGVLFAKTQMSSGMWPVSPITVLSDSQITIKGMTEWIPGWLARGWRKGNGKPVENRDLWEGILAAAKGIAVNWRWVRGHNGNLWNEWANSLANAAADEAERRGVTFVPAAEKFPQPPKSPCGIIPAAENEDYAFSKHDARAGTFSPPPAERLRYP